MVLLFAVVNRKQRDQGNPFRTPGAMRSSPGTGAPVPGGALRMGLQHSGYCMACCWYLMGLLFVGGDVNLYWIAGLTLFVLLEKTMPVGHWFAHRGWSRHNAGSGELAVAITGDFAIPVHFVWSSSKEIEDLQVVHHDLTFLQILSQ